jgi:hypothetical protein
MTILVLRGFEWDLNKAQGLSWALIELQRDLAELGLGKGRRIGWFQKVLARQPGQSRWRRVARGCGDRKK